MVASIGHSMRGLGRRFMAVALVGASLIPMSAMADSTTGTSLSVEGQPTPGKVVYAHVVVTGSHIVFAGPGTVFGGTVDLSLDGNVIARVQVDITNTNQTKVDPCAAQMYDGTCKADRVYGDHTEFRYPVTLPAGAKQHTFGAAFSGDTKSHSSAAPNVTIKAVYPGIAAAISLLD